MEGKQSSEQQHGSLVPHIFQIFNDKFDLSGQKSLGCRQPAAQAQQLSNAIFEEHNMLQMRPTCLNATPYMNRDRTGVNQLRSSSVAHSEAVVTPHFTNFKKKSPLIILSVFFFLQSPQWSKLHLWRLIGWSIRIFSCQLVLLSPGSGR